VQSLIIFFLRLESGLQNVSNNDIRITKMIMNFGDTRTARLYDGEHVKGFPADVVKSALYKLDMLNNARSLDDLRIPPGNRLEALQGDLRGFHSIRVNAQWRIVFRWHDGGAEAVRLVDYH
jgi:proteic killer suppression protein